MKNIKNNLQNPDNIRENFIRTLVNIVVEDPSAIENLPKELVKSLSKQILNQYLYEVSGSQNEDELFGTRTRRSRKSRTKLRNRRSRKSRTKKTKRTKRSKRK